MKKLGVSTSSIVESPKRRRKKACERLAEEKAWAARSGPVTVRFIEPEKKKPE